MGMQKERQQRGTRVNERDGPNYLDGFKGMEREREKERERETGVSIE